MRRCLPAAALLLLLRGAAAVFAPSGDFVLCPAAGPSCVPELRSACANVGLEPAVPESDAENAAAFAACGEAWLGITDEGVEGEWRDVNTGDLLCVDPGTGLFFGECIAEPGRYTNWFWPPQPIDLGLLGTDYAFFFIAPGSTGQWVDGADMPLPACCQTPREPRCSAGITNNDGSVCCAAECGVCGGCGCGEAGAGMFSGADFCCPNTIASNGIRCATSSEVGCVLRDEGLHLAGPRGPGCDV